MGVRARRTARLWGAVLVAVLWAGTAPGTATALEIGEPAPDFTLPATTRENISLSQFRGKKIVLLEFYVHDFGPT